MGMRRGQWMNALVASSNSYPTGTRIFWPGQAGADPTYGHMPFCGTKSNRAPVLI